MIAQSNIAEDALAFVPVGILVEVAGRGEKTVVISGHAILYTCIRNRVLIYFVVSA